ncbi:PH domain-containing protein [Chitinophaga eiseniae]|uniref:PH domain-containing protein n=1 Tax=Chitinophaga eiseniae TaxID=634771 RepID=A0A1T4SQE2_9BACT|nr:PH domain-containing protein [Chitinophaga eiseniae]SKA30366.1 PH domain-containing protein [Chitinophaga eiseniae]
MQQEYTYSRGFRIFVFCLISPFALIPLSTIGVTIVAGVQSGQDTLWGFISMIPCIAVVIYVISEMLSVVSVDEKGIRYRSLLFRREMLWQEVRGYRLAGRLELVPAAGNKRRFKVAARRMNYDNLVRWIMARYPDLRKKTKEQMSSTDMYPQHELRMAKYTAWVLNGAAFVLMLACIFLVRHLPWLPFLLIAMLPVTVAALEYHKGLLIIADGRKIDTLPPVLMVFIFCAIGLFVVAVPVFSLRQKELLQGALIITGVFTLLVIFVNRHWKLAFSGKLWSVIMFVVFFTPASYDSLVYINTYFDDSPPALFETTIYDKRISKRRTTSYYLMVEPWGPVKSAVSIPVKKKKYEATAVGAVIKMELHRGALGVPWYTPGILKRE